jgi:hypothetical protein
MPDFDGNGPLKRGRIIRRGRGPCNKSSPECPQEYTSPENRHEDKTSAQ